MAEMLWQPSPERIASANVTSETVRRATRDARAQPSGTASHV